MTRKTNQLRLISNPLPRLNPIVVSNLTQTRAGIAPYITGEANRCQSCGCNNWYVGRIHAECANCKLPIPIVTRMDMTGLNYTWGAAKTETSSHHCSYETSTFIGGYAECATFHCNVCDEQWEKDVS